MRRSPRRVGGCSRSSRGFARLVVEGIAARLAASTRAAVAAEAAAADAAVAKALAEALVAMRARAVAPLQVLSAAAAPEGIRYALLAHTDVGRLTHRASMYTSHPRSGLTRPGIHDDKANSSPGSKPRILLRTTTRYPTRYKPPKHTSLASSNPPATMPRARGGPTSASPPPSAPTGQPHHPRTHAVPPRGLARPPRSHRP